ncbi:MAG: energy transducer TonB [Saprospiraceae bacterium]
MLIILALALFKFALQAQTDETPFTFVEKMPEFVGGNKKMNRFISDNIHFPDECRNEGPGYVVIVQFVVDTSGYISNPKVVRGARCGCNQEAMRIMNLMNENNPHWIPGMHNGRKVRVQYTLPIKFERNMTKD